MTATTAGGGSEWGVGSVIGTAGSTLFGHFVPFVGTALVASLPGLVINLLTDEVWVKSIIDLIIGQIVTVTLIYGTVQALRGRGVTIGESLSEGWKRLGAAILVAIVMALGIGVGMVLLIVPGLILATMWAVAIPSATIERTDVGASLSRSSALTRGRRWRVFGALLVAGLISVAAGAIIGGIGGAVIMTGVGPGVLKIAVWIVTSMTQAFSACVTATLYYFLRREKEGVDINQIASVFD
jgi:hypothetical protein